MARRFPLLFDPANAGRLWIVEEDGRIVAHAGYCAPGASLAGTSARVVCFGAIFTEPDRRRRGLASAVLAAALAAARAEGAQLAMISGERPLYRRLGFEPLPATSFLIASATAHPYPPSTLPLADGGERAIDRLADTFIPRPISEGAWEVLRATKADVAALAALHDAEPVRFVRSPDDWLKLLKAGTVFYGPGAVMLVRRDERAVAYAALERRSTTLPGGGTIVRAVEIAGDRSALADAVPALAVAVAAPAPIALPALPHDQRLAELGAARGWPAVTLQLPFSASRLDPALANVPLPWYGLNYV
jgi:hypothetical protein